ncbi:hypothetical protein [Enterobacter roggenkampii]|uniref:hypothetical protein n=1 Tax=Enterobacter roggenkampii TaxID=1812935 RepID=UPI00321A6F60
MNILFSQAENDAIDANGSEPVSQAVPSWFQGTFNELGRGVSNIGTLAKRNVLQTDESAADALGVNQYVTREGRVAKIHDIEPTPPEQLPKFEKPDAENSGAAAIILGDLMESVPTILSAVVSPFAGFAMGVASGGAHAQDEAAAQGITGEAAKAYTAIRALSDGVGGAMPGIGGIGERALLKYGSRFVVGGAANTALSEADQWSRASVLEAYGYTKQAEQLRQWDTQQAMATFLMGGAFNLAGGHARERDANPRTMAPETATPDALNQIAGAPESTLAPEAQTSSAQDSTPGFTPLAGYRLSRADVKQVKSDLANARRHLDRIDAERASIIDAQPTGSAGANRRYYEANRARLDDLEAQRRMSQGNYDSAAARLDSHQAYGRQRIDALNADAATHTVLHDNYVTESAPGLAVDTVSESAHVRAMDSAMRSVDEGRAVDVTDILDGEGTFLIHSGNDINAGAVERQTLAGDVSSRVNRVVQAAEMQSVAEKASNAPQPGMLTEGIAQPFDMLRTQADALRETHPELADALSPHIDAIDAEYRVASAEAKQYDIAAACAITYGQ